MQPAHQRCSLVISLFRLDDLISNGKKTVDVFRLKLMLVWKGRKCLCGWNKHLAGVDGTKVADFQNS